MNLEAEHYSKSWQELYDHDENVLKETQEFDKLIDATTPPYWFWPGLDDWQRKFGWRMSHDQFAQTLFDTMLDRLKKFVDREAKVDEVIVMKAVAGTHRQPNRLLPNEPVYVKHKDLEA